jgi:hypothetical protein
MEIDLVYLWVDGNDPAWLARKRAMTGDFSEGGETNSKARYVSNDELRYSLRSAEACAPWIRKIFIVTDGQTPEWLDTSNPRVRVVDHSEILPPEARPCFNSSVLEYFIHKIPDLAERFIFANDDMFFGAPVEPSFFFAPDGLPIVRLKRKRFTKLRLRLKEMRGRDIGNYRTIVHRAALGVKALTGRFVVGVPHHNIDAYLKSDYRHVIEDVFGEQAVRTTPNHLRTDDDLNRAAVGFWAVATGCGHLKFVGRGESLRISDHKPDFMKVLRRYDPQLFCLNDDQHTTDDDRRRIEPFLRTLYPTPSQFEKR